MSSIKNPKNVFLLSPFMILLVGIFVSISQLPANGQLEQAGIWRANFTAGVKAYRVGRYEEAVDASPTICLLLAALWKRGD